MSEPGIPSPHDDEIDNAALCHDLRQYVAAGLALSDLHGLGGEDTDVRHRMDAIAEVFEEIKEALDHDDARRQRPTTVDLADVARECVAVSALVSTVPVRAVAPRRVKACANATLLRRAVLNLVSNATRAAAAGGSVQVEVGTSGREAWLEVRDDGAGFGRIPSGSGLGLAVVESAARSSGGRMEITSGPGPGTRVRLWLPRPQLRAVRP